MNRLMLWLMLNPKLDYCNHIHWILKLFWNIHTGINWEAVYKYGKLSSFSWYHKWTRSVDSEACEHWKALPHGKAAFPVDVDAVVLYFQVAFQTHLGSEQMLHGILSLPQLYFQRFKRFVDLNNLINQPAKDGTSQDLIIWTIESYLYKINVSLWTL